MKEENEFGNDFIIPQKETILTRFFKWIVRLFHKKETKMIAEMTTTQNPDITIPKAVKIPEKMEEIGELGENSLEYLYQLADDELDHLSDLYDTQMEEHKKEIERLNGILQAYKNAIKDIQGKIAEE